MLQKRAAEGESAPHRLQNRPAPTATILTGTYRSAEQAQISAINQPMTVQPKSKFTMKMAAESAWCRPIMVGRKYRSAERIINVTFSPLSLRTVVRARLSACFYYRYARTRRNVSLRSFSLADAASQALASTQR
jgi:hypothetical protein